MNILLTNQTSLHNLGDEIILIETLRLLDEVFPDASVTVTFHQLAGAHAAIPDRRVLAGFEAWAYTADEAGRQTNAPAWQRLADLARLAVVALAYRLCGRAPRLFADEQKQALVDAIAAADLVIMCGGGYLYDTPRRQGALGRAVTLVSWSVFMLLAALLAVLMRKPLALLPLSVGPLHDPLLRRLTAWIVRRARIACVRERASLKLLRELGCAGRALYVPDLAFGFATAPAHAEAARALLLRAGMPQKRPPLCVGITAIDWGAQNPAFTGQEAYERALVGLIDAVTARGGTALLFAHSVTAVAAWDDRLVNERLRAASRHPQQVLPVHEPCPPEVLQAAYATLDCLVGTRMHSAIMALNAGTPVVAVGSLHKTRGVLGELGLAQRCFDIACVTVEALTQALDEALAAPADRRVRDYIAFARRSHRAIGAILRGLVSE